MSNFRPSISAVAALCLTSACVSAPRPYSPTLQVAATDQTAFESAFRLCADEVAAGKRSNFRSSRAANVTGVVVVVGGTQMVVGGASAISLGGGGIALAGLGLVVLTPVALYGLSRAKRARNEKVIKAAMTACLAEEGYAVTEWRRVDPKTAGGLMTPVKAAKIAR